MLHRETVFISSIRVYFVQGGDIGEGVVNPFRGTLCSSVCSWCPWGMCPRDFGVIDGVHPNAGDSPCKSGQLVWGIAVFRCGSSVHTGLKVNIPRPRWMDVERQRLGVL